MQRAFATCPRGMESLLTGELRQLGAASPAEGVGGVSFEGSLTTLYRVCLWSRLASRVLLVLSETEVAGVEDLYQAARAVDWTEHFDVSRRFVVRFRGAGPGVSNTQFGARRVKDAVADRFRERVGERPSVDLRSADIAIHARLHRARLTLSLDLSGESLHRRGYRLAGGPAPLKENLAAALLLRAGWSGDRRFAGLLDPLCGSGTLLIEAALMAQARAPGAERRRWGFQALRGHDPEVWRELWEEARAAPATVETVPPIVGFDADPEMVRAARENAARAGVEGLVRVERRALAELSGPPGFPAADALLVTNPPYGVRLGDGPPLAHLYRELGQRAREHFGGSRLAVFCGAPELASALRLRAERRYRLWNGRIRSDLMLFELNPRVGGAPAARLAADAPAGLSAGARMFANRLAKNLRRLKPWLKRERIECFRLYDADIPEYSVAVDVYGDWAHVAEYAAPRSVDADRAARRMVDVTLAIPDVLDIAPERIVVKQRARQRGSDQYEKQAGGGRWVEVREGPARVLLNLTGYIDTGLFLDHRRTRRRLAELAPGARFLNLYCYTATATVQAALGGARTSVSVDLSRTYLDWARRNFELNRLDPARHRLERADCLEWLRGCRETFDLIFLDPPTFSNSKRSERDLDLQRDHSSLIRLAAARLAPDGALIFSTNRRRFSLDPDLARDLPPTDITRPTLDPDFPWPRAGPPAHRCWQFGVGPQ